MSECDLFEERLCLVMIVSVIAAATYLFSNTHAGWEVEWKGLKATGKSHCLSSGQMSDLYSDHKTKRECSLSMRR